MVHPMTITVKSGATLSTTGGSDVVYTLIGTAGNKSTFAVLTDTDLRLRRTVEVTVKPPVVNASQPNGYSQMRVKFYWKEPILLANGKITVNGKVDEFHYDVEAASAVKVRLLDASAQADFVSAIVTAYKDGALLT